MKRQFFLIFLFFSLFEQFKILFNYEYIPSNLYDKKEFIKYVLEDWAVDRINTVLDKKNEDDFEFPNTFECEGITEIKQMPQNLNADLLIFILLENTNSFIATSKTCYYHPVSKRPIVGVIKLSMVRIQIFTENSFYAANTLLHEVIHIMGFSEKNFEQNPLGKDKFVQNNSLVFSKISNVARKHFNCQSVGSIHLENEGGSSSNGNHFEFLQLGNELMNPQFSTSPVLSDFTISVLDQTGYYDVNYDKAEPLIWGMDQGCNFTGKCKSEFIEFCTEQKQITCSQDFASKAICEETNFSNNCLIPNEQIGYSCRRNYDLIQTSALEESGKNSRCFLTEQDNKKTAGCYKTECSSDGNVLEIKIGENWYLCDSANKNYVVQNVKVYCPDPKIFCKRTRLNECSEDCNGKGQCLKDGSCFCDYFYSGNNCTKFADCQQGSNYLCQQLKKTFHKNTFSFAILITAKILFFGILNQFMIENLYK